MNAATYSLCYKSAFSRLRRLIPHDPQLCDALTHDTIVKIWSKYDTDSTPPELLAKQCYRRAFWMLKEYHASLADHAQPSDTLDSIADSPAPAPLPQLATSPQEIADLIDDPKLADFALVLAFLPDSTESAAAAIGISRATAYRYRQRLQSELGQSQVAYAVCSALASCLSD